MSKINILYRNHDRTIEQLKRLQKLPLEQKVILSKRRIERFLDVYNKECYVAFSGGKDSTVLLDIVRQIDRSIPAVFSDTGLEYPEIRSFVKTIDNVVWVRPTKTFKQVIDEYGYPIVSKKVAHQISLIKRIPNGKAAKLYLSGITSDGKNAPSWKLSNKWLHLIDAPFKISEKCCDYLKKQPLNKYNKKTGKKPIIGTMADEGEERKKSWLKSGCNSFNAKQPKSTPLAFWTEKDIWEYIHRYKIAYSEIYDKGEERTGCMFCMFGCGFKGGLDRFKRMKENNPAQYKYCMENLGLREVIQYTFGEVL